VDGGNKAAREQNQAVSKRAVTKSKPAWRATAKPSRSKFFDSDVVDKIQGPHALAGICELEMPARSIRRLGAR
jgi:hypothetical protein